MANRLKVQEQEAILTLTSKGWGVRRIARELKISRNTVRHYLRSKEPANQKLGVDAPLPDQTDPPLSTAGAGNPAVQTDPLSTAGNSGRKSHCLEHQSFILAKLELGLTAQRIYQDLQAERGFAGSYESVKRYVHNLRNSTPDLVQRLEVQSGEEVQVDFGAGPLLIDEHGKKRRTWIFRMVLSYSRKGYSEAVLRQDTETFIRCLENAFRHFGGVPLTVNLDNLKAAVIKADWADPDLNPKLREFARHYGVAILPCLPRVPEHKGKIENGVKYVKHNALAGRSFASLAELNRFLAHWEKTVADQRIHGTTKRQVAALFTVEKPALRALPPSLFPCFQEGPRTVHRDGYVEVEKAFYHAPAEFVRQQVWVRYDSREVRLFTKNKDGSLRQIQIHRRLEPGKFTNARGIGGGQGSLQANLEYWLGRASNLGSSCQRWARTVTQNRGIEGMRSLIGLVSLAERHSFSTLNDACAKALAKGTLRLRDIRALLAVQEEQTVLTFEEHHPLIRNLREYGLFVRTRSQSQNS